MEIQINLEILDRSINIPNKIIATNLIAPIIDNNTNELIRHQQKGGIFTRISGEYCKLVSTIEKDSTRL